MRLRLRLRFSPFGVTLVNGRPPMPPPLLADLPRLGSYRSGLWNVPMDAFLHRPHTDEASASYTPESDDQYIALYQDVALRLRTVCGEMPPENFDALVRGICLTKLRWAARDDGAAGRTR